MKQISKPILIAVLVLLAASLSFFLFSTDKSDPMNNVSLEQRQKQFAQYADTVQLKNKSLIFENSGPLCSSSSGSGQTDCTLSKVFIYKLDGDYRDNGKDIFSYLKSEGFDFRQDSKYKDEVENKLNNTKLANNLSNSEPIIVDLYNPQNKARVRVNLGDYGRTMPYAKGQALDQLSSDQLIAGLQFYNP